MGLTWRDVVSSTGIVIILVAYAAYQGGTSLVLISSGWAASAVVLPLAIGCAWFAAGDLYSRQQPLPGRIIRRATTLLGAIGILAGLIGLVTASALAVKILVMAILLLWGTATCWHVHSIGSDK